jgi:hypothetical protein
MPFGAEDRISRPEVWIDKGAQGEGHVVIKTDHSRELSEIELGIQLNSVRRESDCDSGRSACGIRDECQVAVVLPDPVGAPFNHSPIAFGSNGPVVGIAVEYQISERRVEIGLVVGTPDSGISTS